MESPTISHRAKKTLQDLRDSGRTVSDADVVWLVTLAAKIDRPVGDELGPLSGSPLIVEGVEFWPLTWLARDWFYKWHDILVDASSPVADYIFAYAHTMSNTGNRALLRTDSYALVKADVEAWIRTLPFNAENLVEITSELINRWQGKSGETIPNPDSVTSESFCKAPSSDESLAYLSSQLGGNPDYWRYDIAMERTQEMYTALSKSTDTAGSAPDPHSPRIRAIHNYHMAVKWVIANG
jgi:hypothetical protein